MAARDLSSEYTTFAEKLACKLVNTLKPTVRHVSEIVPQNLIPKLKPTLPR